MAVVLAIANHNRGVGKTVTAANVSAGLARAGRRTLAVDGDAQADLTRWLLGRVDEEVADLEAVVVGGAAPAAAVRPTRVAGLEVLPATPRLADLARVLAAEGAGIARVLGRLRPGYGAMVLDLPSRLGWLTVAALVAADGIVIPVPASPVGLLGWPVFVTGWPACAASGSSPRRCGGCWGPRPTWTPGGMGTLVGREVRDALADFGVSGARLLPVLVPRRVGVEGLVSQRLLVGDPAAHAGPGRAVVEAYARLVDDLLERIPPAPGPPAAEATP